ncbi:MAG: hypothetical protein FWH00_01010, partial [Oscillospiraceae bacterium]|nr:hypothetical protein [Oscillospiraceae bacterium]
FSRDPPPKSAASIPEQPQASASQEYAGHLEERITALVSEIEGVGRLLVMVTLANSGEYVFAQEEKRSSDRDQQRENLEQKYVIVESDNGRRQALVRTRLEPGVQGVVIICEGADDIFVRSRVVNAVTTALNISSARVSVEKIRVENPIS